MTHGDIFQGQLFVSEQVKGSIPPHTSDHTLDTLPSAGSTRAWQQSALLLGESDSVDTSWAVTAGTRGQH